METNEIMTNEEVTEAVETMTDEIATKKFSSKLKMATGGLTILVGGIIAWHYIAKPVLANIKAKKQKFETIEDISNDVPIDIPDETYNSDEEVEEEK